MIYYTIKEINRHNNDLEGEDTFSSSSTSSRGASFTVRFHLYPGVNAVKTFGSQTIVVGIDYDKNLNCYSHSGKVKTDKKLFDWAKRCEEKKKLINIEKYSLVLIKK